MLTAILSYIVLGLLASTLLSLFIIKPKETKKHLYSLQLGYIISSFLIILFKRINWTVNKNDDWYIRFASDLITSSKNIDDKWLIIIIFILLITLFLSWNKNPKKKRIPININESPEEDSYYKVKIKVKDKEFRPYESDLLPLVDIWVGRDPEIELLESIKHGVIAITGFGGQGKSALAAKHVKNTIENNNNTFWDWRDCKEESDRFRTQLISIISNLTTGDFPVDSLSNSTISEISKMFFRIISKENGIIVFDNVDHYVDLHENLFTSDISSFINEALRVDHNMSIIFTCRPRVSYPSPRFREIYLRGFDLEETKELFHQKIPGGLKNELIETVTKFHKFSEGHPLWLNIIAAQIARKPNSANEILKGMEAGQMDDRAKSMLRSIWNSLNPNQKSILRCMAEVQKSVEEDVIFDFVKNEVANQNRFNRAFRGLVATNIVTERTDLTYTTKKYDLHPMVRTFIRNEYRSRNERSHYISLVLNYYDNFLTIHKNKKSTLSIEILNELLTKTELEIENGDFTKAIDTLVYASDDFITRGLTEEYIRLSKKIFLKTDWSSSDWVDSEIFDNLIIYLIRSMIEIGNTEEGITYLEEYTKNINPGTARYISVCDLNCYVWWFLHDFSKAIKWGQRGVDLKNSSGIDTKHESEHTLALALRDGNRLDDALDILSYGAKIEDILSDDHKNSDRGAAFYGNIGRCLELKDDFNNALILYAKSYELLEEDSGSVTLINKGYASFWLASTLFSLGKTYESYLFAKRAKKIWEVRSPTLLSGPNNLLLKLDNHLSGDKIKFSDSEIDIECRNFITSILTS